MDRLSCRRKSLMLPSALVLLALLSCAPVNGLFSVTIDLPDFPDLRILLDNARNDVESRINTAVDNLQTGFDDFKARFQRTYDNTADEQRGMEAFRTAVQAVRNQAANASFLLDLGPLADLTHAEFEKFKLGLNTTNLDQIYNATLPTRRRLSSRRALRATLPDAVNWVTEKKVVPVKDQGQCGCCWAFAATSVIETQSAIFSDTLYSLSDQQVLSCGDSQAVNGDGCNGGELQWGFQYALDNEGLTAESAYAYEGDGTLACDTAAADWKVVQISGIEWVARRDEQALMEALSQGSVLVPIAGSSELWQYYAGGVLDDFSGCCTTSDCQGDLNHAIALVGYNTTANPPYWLGKNSWGTSWGENGYVRLAMGTPTGYPSGICGILTAPLAATKDSANQISGTAPDGATLEDLSDSASSSNTASDNSAGAVASSALTLGAAALGALGLMLVL